MVGVSAGKWQRIAAPIKNTGAPEATFVRCYGPDGAKWPRLTISLYVRGGNVAISTSWKERPGAWWDPCELPLELVGELREMLESVATRDWPEAS